MKKLLPIFSIFIFSVFAFFIPSHAYAQTITPTVTPVPTGIWVVDPEVTFIGKNAARSGLLLDWTLQNYNWVCVTKVSNRQCDDNNNPIASFWSTIVMYIVVPLLFLVILATAAIIILTRGRSITVARFIPRFIAVIVLILFSYSILQFLYQFTDLIQGFFLRTGTASCPPDCISQKDLLFVGWNYQNFIGLRLTGDAYTESAFISLLLTKMTALTYFVMSGILLIRKIILWFFVIISPIFPLLLLYYPVRNTGKVWIGEFFRWVLYAPLFAIFLKGLVYLWQHKIPLIFIPPGGTGAIGDPNQVIFPTAINILLGGPQQLVSPSNSVNLTETFALYVVALIMLWIVVILPWILLQIFLDYATSLSADSNIIQGLTNIVNNKQTNVGPTQPSVPSPAQPANLTLNLPFKKLSIPFDFRPAGAAKQITTDKLVAKTVVTKSAVVPKPHMREQTTQLANIAVPSMRDIARFESALLAKDTRSQQETKQMREHLERIANPEKATESEKTHYKELREKLIHESYRGNIVATSILRAASSIQQTSTVQASTSDTKTILQQIANPAIVTNTTDREHLTKLNKTLIRESKENNNQLATSILSVNEKTSDLQVERIKQELRESAILGNSTSSSIISTINSHATNQQETTHLRTILSQIANPAQITTASDRERFSALHESLVRESRENNNQLATSILAVNEKTSMSELSHIKEQLQVAQSNSVMSTVSQTIQEHQSTATLKTVLQQISNPALVTNTIDRERMISLNSMLEKESTQKHNQLASSILEVNDKTSNMQVEQIREQLFQAREQGNVMATSVMSTVSSVASKSQTTEQVRDVLQQIANPASVSSFAQREKFQKVHEALVRESHENNSKLASSILAVTDKTSTTDIEKIREQLLQAKESTVLNNVNSLLSQQQTTYNLRTIYQQIANPALVTNAVDKEKFTQIHDNLVKEQQNRNELAQAVLGVTDKTSSVEIEKLHEKVRSSREQGNPLATQVAAITDKSASLPVVNRVQAVTQEDYEAVKKMWKENYQDLQVPLGMATTRQEWIKDDIDNIDRITGLLTSQDPERVNLGMQEVSHILPFLMVGGFSLTEIIAYLKAKQEAAKESMLALGKEDQQVSVSAQATTAKPQQMAASIEESSSPSYVSTHVINPQVSDEILLLTSLTVPTMKDIVRYEIIQIRHDTSSTTEIQKMREVLEKIANPQTITDTTEKEHYTQLRDKLLQESSKGNATAQTVLSTASKTAPPPIYLKEVMQQILNPTRVATPDDKRKFGDLHDKLIAESSKGNTLASSLLAVSDKTSLEDMEKLHTQLTEAKQKGESLADYLLDTVDSSTLPETNRLQQISQDDFEEIEKMWEENYRTLPVPQEYPNTTEGRIEWINKDIEEIKQTLSLLQSSKLEERREGLKKVSSILPFLMLGGFSYREIIGYLSAKLEAATNVIKELKKDEEGMQIVDVESEKAEQPKEMAAEEEEEK